ncbi:MAG: tyrosine-type recombinase/integrase [Prevotellaceae bacterium]|jgi:integrase|nr:tyrosine-type recombinase/integrase [Prevotellaceae bacterium]
MEKKLFSLPKISKCGTFISFNYWNAEKWKYERFKKHLSTKFSPEERHKEALKMLLFWTNELKNGYNPIEIKRKNAENTELNTVENSIRKVCSTENTALDAHVLKLCVQNIWDSRTEFLRRKTRLTYSSKVTCFLEWAQMKGFDKMLANDFTVEQAERFLAYLQAKRGVGNTTRNCYMLLMRSLWDTMKKHSIVESNVWEKIDKVREERMGMLPFKSAQKQRIKAYLLEHDPELWLFVQFEYYCFIRPGELRCLTINAIDLDEGTILVDAHTSKNKKSEYVIIPPPLWEYLKKIQINYYNPNYYIFSKSGQPGEEQYGYNTMYERHRRVLRTLGYNNRYSLYSWKHTGACDAIRAGVKIKELQIQLRHADLQTTDIYLRSIGIKDLDDLREKFPEL